MAGIGGRETVTALWPSPVVYIAMNYNIVNPYHGQSICHPVCVGLYDSKFTVSQNSPSPSLSPTAGVSGILAAAVK